MQGRQKAAFIFTFFVLAFNMACQSNQESRESDGSGEEMDHTTRLRLRQYMSQGKVLYMQQCANCHQEDGTGLGNLYPPLLNSDYMKESVSRTICIIKNGQEGEIEVNGKIFDQPMPANPNLTDLEIAEIATYIYNRFGEENRIISLHDVNDALQNCQSESL